MEAITYMQPVQFTSLYFFRRNDDAIQHIQHDQENTYEDQENTYEDLSTGTVQNPIYIDAMVDRK